MRDTKDKVGRFTAFTSIEPITASCDEIDLTGMDWVITGGESGPRCRPMAFEWLEQANENALSAGIPLHFKQYGHARNNQYGHARNNPLVQRHMANGVKLQAAYKKVISDSEELAPEEKGGATYKGRVYHQKPPHWHTLRDSLNKPF
jgi:hypothetical protein